MYMSKMRTKTMSRIIEGEDLGLEPESDEEEQGTKN